MAQNCFGCTHMFTEHARMQLESDRSEILHRFEYLGTDWKETSKRLEKVQERYLECGNCILEGKEFS